MAKQNLADDANRTASWTAACLRLILNSKLYLRGQ